MALHFSKEEFHKRKSNILESMNEQNLDALLIFRQESMYWLTGYDTFGFVFFQSLILDKRGNTILLTRAPDLRQAQNTSFINDIRIWLDEDKSNPSDDLKNIFIETHEPAIRIISNKNILNNASDRDHSLEYMVAAALIFGDVTSDSYEDTFEGYKDIEQLRKKIIVKENQC